MIGKFIDRKFKPKLKFLTFRLHRKLRYAVLVLFGLATLALAVTLSGLPTTPEILDVATPADWAAPALFAAALALTAFTLGKAYTFQNETLLLKGFLLTHSLKMTGVEGLERAERWGFAWFRIRCGSRTFLVFPPDDPDEFATCVQQGMDGKTFEGSYTKYGGQWFI